MDDTSFAAASATESIDADAERQLDDLEDLDDDDTFESLGGFDLPEEIEQLGGYSESTSFEDPPLE